MTDACSRYLLRCQAVARPDTEHVWPMLDAALREYGLPPVCAPTMARPCFAWRWRALADGGEGDQGRRHAGAHRPGKPQENGRHERLHRTLLQDAAAPPAGTLREQLKRLRAFQRLYNEERPHAALDNATPAERYKSHPVASMAFCASRNTATWKFVACAIMARSSWTAV